MIKTQNSLPEIVPDGSNPTDLTGFLTQVKLVIQDILSKAQSRQMEIRSTIPTVNDLEEGEYVAYENGVNHYVFTKQNGVIRYWALT